MIWIIAIALAICFGLGTWLGAPYLPMRRVEAEKALDLLDFKPGQTLVDLGSGDGAVLLAAAKRGIKGVGYEINPLLWVLSIIRTMRYRRLVKFKLGDMWRADLQGADAVFIFGIGRYMDRFDKLLKGSGRPLKVISYAFELPRKAEASEGAVHLYRY